jgi:hypothetical protein|tara:strand:+ start:228 stop:506 length:279 start_codon:yes stop_codon:yes gene_type:complete
MQPYIPMPEVSLERFKELLADDGIVEDSVSSHSAYAVASGFIDNQFDDEFVELFRSVLDEDPMNILNPERIAYRFVKMANDIVEQYHKEECV